jgi:L1 cell adhesion molecule like protein
VTFEIDANGILSVNAVEKSTNSSKNITITNDKGRLSKEDIETMLKDAEHFKEEDERNAQRIESRNGFETYLYNVKSSVVDGSEAVVPEGDKEQIKKIIEDNLAWLDSNQMASSAEYEDKKKDVEGVVNGLLQKAAAGAPPPAASGEPTVEEI